VVRPFLKWAGGKRQLLPTLSLYYPATFDRYVEPFLGSGAVFFDLCGKGLLGGRRALLSDSNADLIGCYQALRDHTDAVIVALERLEAEHRSRGSACYYDVREHRFNPARAGRVPTSRAAMRGGPAAIDYTPELAAMFIYLNRTGFNGLFRLNRRGAFNVPAGRYVNPRICDSGHLRTAAAALQMPGVSLSLSSFEQTLGQAGTGDFVYCDPPYAPLSRTSLFAHYTAGGFTMVDHRRLYTAVVAAAQRGAAIVMSNSSAAEVVDLYRNGEGVAAGLSVDRVKARRAINSRATLRGPVDELVISNTRTVRLRDAKQRMLKVGLKQGTRLKAQGSRSNSL
jgi:DNA adenine methylase